MGEAEIIGQTTIPNTQDTLVRDLRALGLTEGDVLLVHSSLSSIGWVCGGEIAVIQALLQVIGDTGTLVMPAHCGDNSDPAKWARPPVPKEWWDVIYDNMPAFDRDATPTRGMGRIADRFRTYPGTARSNHPQVSFCARGRMRDEVVSEHHLTPQFGLQTPLGKLYRMDAKVLLLGVGFSNCTSFHLAEHLTGCMPASRMGTAMMVDGLRQWVWFEDMDFDDEDFTRIGGEYENGTRAVSVGKVGNAACRLFDMKPAVDYATQWMLRHRKWGEL